MSALTESNKAFVQRVFTQMWNQHSISAARELFTQPEGVENFVTGFLQAFPDLRHEIVETIAEDDRVAVRFIARGTHRGQWKDFAPTGRSISYTGITLARVEHGMIVDHQTWWDTYDLIEQITRLNA